MDSGTLVQLSLLFCLAGVFLRVMSWFFLEIGPLYHTSAGIRFRHAGKAILRLFNGRSLLCFLQSLFLDVVVQKKLAAKGWVRWLGHGFILVGFIGLLIIHGLGPKANNFFFDYHFSTLNPFLFLRNVFGLMVLVGVVMGIIKRARLKGKRLFSSAQDWFALMLVGLLVVSGFVLEGAKISSYSVYERMVEENSVGDAEENLALETLWVTEYGLVSPRLKKSSADQELLVKGREISGYYCDYCHGPNSSAFGSYIVARTTGGFVAMLGDQKVVDVFFILHVFCWVVFLIWIPFGKMFHIFSAPVSLIVAGQQGENNKYPTLQSKHILGLSACTHCGACSMECSAMVFSDAMENRFILPSEKVQALKKIVAGKKLPSETIKKLQEGLYICSSCDRCTSICPSGINLRQLFVDARYQLLEAGEPEFALRSHFSFPLTFSAHFRGNHLEALQKVEALFSGGFKKLTDLLHPITPWNDDGLPENVSYQSCYSCQKCTNICPVVRRYDNPGEQLDLLPHQIIFSLGAGNSELARGSRMIWSCSTCYMCQEHCPNGVELCDIFYTLKNMAIEQIQAGGTKV